MIDFPHPWSTEEWGRWSGILGVCSGLNTGKTRVALEYARSALAENRTVVYITNDTPESTLQQYILERPHGAGRFVTREIRTSKDVFQQIATYSVMGDLIILDCVDFTSAGIGISITNAFDAMKSAYHENHASFLVTIAGKDSSDGLPWPRSDRIAQNLDVMMCVVPQTAYIPAMGQNNLTDEELVKDVDRTLRGDRGFAFGCLKNREMRADKGHADFWDYIDYATMEKIGLTSFHRENAGA